MKQLTLRQGVLDIVNPNNIFIGIVVWSKYTHYFRLIKKDGHFGFNQIPTGYRDVWQGNCIQYACDDYMQWAVRRHGNPTASLIEFKSEQEFQEWFAKQNVKMERKYYAEA